MGGRRAVRRSFGDSVERGLRLAIGIALLGQALVFAVALADWPSYDARDRALAGAVVALVTLAGLRCVADRANGADVLLCTGALVAETFLTVDQVPLAVAPDSPVLHLAPPLLVALALRRPRPLPTIAALCVLYVALRLHADGTDGLHLALQEAVLVGGTAVGALYLLTQMRRSVRRAEGLRAARRTVEDETMTAAEVEATSFLHDDLVPTLLTVASMPQAPETRAAAAEALRRIEHVDTAARPGDLVAPLREVAAREGLAAEVVVDNQPRRLPRSVRDALLGAAGEALRNVARHSGQDRVTITVAGHPGGVRVLVEDPGRGFDTARGVGLRVAVVGRLDAVGGTARITSTPGAGTRVELTWHRRLLARALGLSGERDQLTRAVVEDPGRVARNACAVLAAGHLATAALLTLDLPAQPRSYAGAAAIAAVVGLLTVLMSLGRLPGPALVAAGVVPAGVLTLALPEVSTAGLGGPESWIIGFSALPALAVAWVAPRRVVALLLVPSAVVIAAVALERGLPAGELPRLLLLQPVGGVLVLAVVAVCQRAGREVVATEGPDRTDWTTAVRDLLGTVAGPVRVALLDAATGTVSEEGATTAALLARSVRDCLYLTGEGHAPLRAELTSLRAAGARAEMTLTEPLAASTTLAAALASLRGVSPALVRITGTMDQMSVVVIPGLTPAAVDRVVRSLPIPWQATSEPEAMVLSGPADLGTLIRRGARRPAPG